MKHATPEALDRIEALLGKLREIEGLRERTRGTFYRRSSAFLHFHEDPKGIFADWKDPASGASDSWTRLPVNTAAQRRALLKRVVKSTS